MGAAQVKAVTKKVAKAAKKGAAKQSTVDAALEQAANSQDAPAADGKQFTWEELQRGDDAKKEIFTENKVGNLQAAPKADKSVGANAVVVGEGDAQVQEE